MRSVLAVAVFSALAVGHPGPPPRHPGPGPGPPARLTAADRELLDGLLCDFLFDPRQATRVRVRLPIGLLWSGTYSVATHERDGWLVLDPGGRPPRVYFTDRGFIPAPPAADIRFVSFEADCRARYVDHGIQVSSLPGFDDSDLARAAWLYRRGHESLAARALAAARESDEDPRAVLRLQLARRAAEELHDAFCLRADLEALGHGARLFQLYPDLTSDTRHADDIMADLVRRWWAGTFGCRPPAGWPPWFALWDVRQKVAWLIGSLDQVDEEPTPSRFQRSGEDRRTGALVGLGEAAVPALLDVIESDRRLTRRPERYRGEPSGRVFTVREEAEAAVRQILRVTQFEPAGPRQRGPTGPRIRRYWQTYGRLPFDERMMAILTDPRARSRARVEAAQHLAWPGPTRPTRWDRAASGPARTGNPAARKFQRPTVADAILAALGGDPSAFDGTGRLGGRLEQERTEDRFLESLVELGDGRVAPELARRAEAAEDPTRRRRFALAAHRLGVSGAWLRLVRDLERGTLPIARGPDGEFDPEVAAGELEQFARALIEHPVPDSDRVLAALADPAHPCHGMVARWVLASDEVWDRHPVCLTVLRRALDDPAPTGRHYYLRGGEIEQTRAERRSERSRLPADRADPAGWAEHAEERVRDVAAERISALVAGVPAYHPLHRDADRAVAAQRAFLDRPRFRRLTWAEGRRLGFRPGESGYVPDLRPLGRPATAADVAAGRAVFHLGGKGRVADEKLPAWVVLKAGPAEGLAVQAEAGADGEVMYGVILRDAVRAVRADEVERVEPR